MGYTHFFAWKIAGGYHTEKLSDFCIQEIFAFFC